MKIVMEKSWNFVIQSWNFTNFALNLYEIWIFLVTTKKLGSDRESLHFRKISAKRRKFKIRERNGHGKSSNGHGKVMEKYFVMSVGTVGTDLKRNSVGYIVFILFCHLVKEILSPPRHNRNTLSPVNCCKTHCFLSQKKSRNHSKIHSKVLYRPTPLSCNLSGILSGP